MRGFWKWFSWGVAATLLMEVLLHLLVLWPIRDEKKLYWLWQRVRMFMEDHGRSPGTTVELVEDFVARDRAERFRLIDAEHEFVSRNGADGAAATLRVMRRDGNPTLQRRFDAFLEECCRQRKRCADVR